MIVVEHKCLASEHNVTGWVNDDGDTPWEACCFCGGGEIVAIGLPSEDTLDGLIPSDDNTRRVTVVEEASNDNPDVQSYLKRRRLGTKAVEVEESEDNAPALEQRRLGAP